MSFGGLSLLGLLFLMAPILGAVIGVLIALRITQSRFAPHTLRLLLVLALMAGVIGMLAAAPRALDIHRISELALVIWWIVAYVSMLLLAGAAIAGGIGSAIRHRQATFLVPAALGILAIIVTFVATNTELIWPFAHH